MRISDWSSDVCSSDLYRAADEASAWPLGDPIERLGRHLTLLGEWDDERHQQLASELAEHVRAEGRASEAMGTLGQGPGLDRSTMFDDVYKDMPAHLKRQREQMLEGR